MNTSAGEVGILTAHAQARDHEKQRQRTLQLTASHNLGPTSYVFYYILNKILLLSANTAYLVSFFKIYILLPEILVTFTSSK